ncbi:MAG: hypothetical protein ACTSU2_06225 [Promethearchaeota archaeon]
MGLKVIFCPYCHKKILFFASRNQVDHESKRYPTPLYVKHDVKGCGNTITVWFDSKMRVSRVDKGIIDTHRWAFCNEIIGK